MSERYANQSLSTTLVARLAPGDPTATVGDASELPDSGSFRIILGTDLLHEIVVVGAISGTTLSSLSRGAEGTAERDWPAGTPVAHVITAGSLHQGIQDAIDNHSDDADPHSGYQTATESQAQVDAGVGVAEVYADAGDEAHQGDATDAHDASAISFAPADTVAATDVQTAILEVATEAAAPRDLIAGHTASGLVAGTFLRATGPTSFGFQYAPGPDLDVRDFGAVGGNSAVDDYPAIQAAIDASHTAAGGGSPPGIRLEPFKTYWTSQPLICPTNTSLEGPAIIKAMPGFTLPVNNGNQTTAMIHSNNGTNIHATARLFLNRILVDGNNVAGLGGIEASLQQQTEWYKVRVQNCPTFGMKIYGQQAQFHNTEILTCGIGLIMGRVAGGPGSAQFMYFFGINIEKCTDAGIDFQVAGSNSNLFAGIHCEFIDITTANATIVRCLPQCNNNRFEEMEVSSYGGVPGDPTSSSQVTFDFGGPTTNPCSYTLDNIRWENAGTGNAWANLIAVRDNYVGKTIKVWDDASGASAARQLTHLEMPAIPTSDTYTGEYGGWTQWGRNGREVRIPGGRRANPSISSKPATDQTGDQLETHVWDSGTSTYIKKTHIDKAGNLTLPTKAGSMSTTDLPEEGMIGVDTTGHVFEFRAGGAIRHVDISALGSLPTMDVPLFIPAGTTAVVWTNMPPVTNPLLFVDINRVRVDLSRFTQVRFNAYLGAIGAAGAYIQLQYSLNQSSWTDIDGSTGSHLAIDANTPPMKSSAWLNLDAAAIADVWLRAAGTGGDNSADPSFGAIHAQFR